MVYDLPAHETFTVPDAGHSKDFLPIALELDGFSHFNMTLGLNLGVAEIFGLLMSVWVELCNVFSLITFNVENLRASTLQASNNLAVEEGDIGELEVQIRIFFVQNQDKNFFWGYHRCLASIVCEHGRDIVPKVCILIFLLDLDMKNFFSFDEIAAQSS